MTKADVLLACQKQREQYPRTADAIESYVEAADFMVTSIAQVIREGDLFWKMAEEVLGLLEEMSGPNYAVRRESLVRYTYEYLKAQVAYTKRGSYAADSFNDVNERVYANAEVMDGFYLDGLLLTQAFWPGHLRMNLFYQESFLKRLKPDVRFCEVGVGQGWFFTQALSARPQSHGTGLDISPFSLNYTAALAHAREIDPARFELRTGDAQAGLGLTAVSMDASVCGEVLEHVSRPVDVVRHIVEVLRPGGIAFFTAPALSDAVDHLYEFRSDQEVLDTIVEGGLRPVDHLSISLSEFSTSGRAWDPTILTSVVAVKPESQGGG